MKLSHCCYLSFTILLIACNRNTGNTIHNILNESTIPSEFFSVNTRQDTSLLTRNGSVINIPKGALESDSSIIQLEIKEALSNTDMLLSGLTTMSGNQALSSGGMIYINAASGYKISVKKQLQILVPTKIYNPGMQVFKGEKQDNGKIDWQDPQPLPEDETLKKIAAGERLFKANCSNCHKLYDDFTGPALYGITERKPKKWLYDFTRNPGGWMLQQNTVPADTIQSGFEEVLAGDSTSEANMMLAYYSHCLMNKWAPVLMTGFPLLTNQGLDGLYAYIKTESDKRPDLKSKFGRSCCDSCLAFGKEIRDLEMKRTKLLQNNINKEAVFFSLDREIPVPTSNVISLTAIGLPPDPVSTKVSPGYVKATYYTINIQAMGWYNIDILMKEYSNCVPSKLFVRMQGSYKIDMNVVLIIPSVKAFIEGGKLRDGKQYGFDETDGNINLPQHAQCYVMAFAEYNDKLIFGKTAFNAQQKQTIDITLSETTKQSMETQIKALNLDGVTVAITADKIKKDSTTGSINNIDKEMNNLFKSAPKNCDCGFNK